MDFTVNRLWVQFRCRVMFSLVSFMLFYSICSEVRVMVGFRVSIKIPQVKFRIIYHRDSAFYNRSCHYY